MQKNNLGEAVEMTIAELNNDRNNQWNGFVDRHDSATIYHRTEWRDLITATFGHKTYFLFSESTLGEINGILPLVRLNSRLFGDYMVSMPYVNYGGVLAADMQIEDSLMEFACTLGRDLGVKHIEFRDSRCREVPMPVRTDKVVMLLDLPGEEGTLWKALGSKRRAQIKRPLREGPQILHGGMELLDDFYRVFAVNMRDLGTPVYAKSFFKAIIEAFPDYHHLVVIKLGGEPVGAAFLLGYKEMLEIPWASTLQSVNSLGINMLMYWEVLKYAIQQGYKTFDFGRSTIDSGTYRFKKQWGAEPRQLYWYYWLKEGQQLPQLTPDNPKYRAAIAVWKKLPVAITNIIGPGIVKNLP